MLWSPKRVGPAGKLGTQAGFLLWSVRLNSFPRKPQRRRLSSATDWVRPTLIAAIWLPYLKSADYKSGITIYKTGVQLDRRLPEPGQEWEGFIL